MNRVLFALVATCCALTAQRVAMTDGSERHVAVVDVADLVLAEAPSLAVAGEHFASACAARLQEIARFVRTFAPAITEQGADLQTLGDRHLVALGKPEQVAAVQRVVLRAREHKEEQFHIDLRVATVPPAVFDREFANTLTPAPAAAPNGERAPHVALLEDERARRLVKTLVGSKQVVIVQSPNLIAPRLDLARIRVGKEWHYVRDFDIDVVNASFDLKPVHDTVFDGFQANVLCAHVGQDTIGVLLDLVDQVVAQPIAEHTTTLPGSTRQVTVQTPHVTGCRGSQAVEMKSGETAIMAARKPDGAWIVSFLTVNAIPSTPASLPVRR